MSNIHFRVLDAFPEPEYTSLAHEAFSDYEVSQLLTAVLDEEAVARKALVAPSTGALRIGAFQNDRLVGWTYARPDGVQLLMVSSGVAPAQRRQGVYSRLVQATLDHAKSRGFVAVLSRHATNNNAVIVAKLKLGFFVSGFEYSEVYGPLVRLTYLQAGLRRTLFQARATPIRRLDSDHA